MTAHVVSWNRESGIDLDDLAGALEAEGVHLRQIDTGTDQQAIILTREPITPWEAAGIWDDVTRAAVR